MMASWKSCYFCSLVVGWKNSKKRHLRHRQRTRLLQDPVRRRRLTYPSLLPHGVEELPKEVYSSEGILDTPEEGTVTPTNYYHFTCVSSGLNLKNQRENHCLHLRLSHAGTLATRKKYPS